MSEQKYADLALMVAEVVADELRAELISDPESAIKKVASAWRLTLAEVTPHPLAEAQLRGLRSYSNPFVPPGGPSIQVPPVPL